MLSGSTPKLGCLASGVRPAIRQDQPANSVMLACHYCSTNCRAIGLRQNRTLRVEAPIKARERTSRAVDYPVLVHQVGSYCTLILLYWFLI
jgi:hypothetical protein